MVSRLGTENVNKDQYSNIGAVVGATYPEELSFLRRDMPSQIFLIPGYGAQGGEADDLRPAFYEGGKGALVNSSRGILFAFEEAGEPEEFAFHAAEAARKAKEDLNFF